MRARPADAQFDENGLADLLRSYRDPWLLDQLPPAVRQRVVEQVIFETGLRNDRGYLLVLHQWLFPSLDAEQIGHLLETTSKADDDYRELSLNLGDGRGQAAAA